MLHGASARGGVSLQPLTQVSAAEPCFQLARYADSLHSSFEVVATKPQVELELVEVRDLRRQPDRQPHAEVFSLLFRGPRSLPLEQRNHVLRHAALGEFFLFLVPVRESDAGLLYEAIVNRQDG